MVSTKNTASLLVRENYPPGYRDHRNTLTPGGIFEARLDRDMEPCPILGARNPPLGHRALDADLASLGEADA
ncbi:DUF302 domain-containing protein [Streptomyces sp. NPDC002458]|uniref:DUF302 domain-containing protein n=1 Tax=Streptomyces sp. NPDC002458 TaxID=3364644 RepID=UPI00367BC4EF